MKNEATWIDEPLKNFINTMNDGGTPSRDDQTNFGGDIPWVVVSDIQRIIFDTKEHLTQKGLASCTSKLWPKETVILSTGATIGKVGITKRAMATKQGITGLIANDRVTPIFLYYELLFQKEKIISWAQGSTFAEIRTPILGKIPLLIPRDKRIQKKISDILISIDEAIEKTEALIGKYQQIKAGLMHDLFTRGITADGKLRPTREQAPELYQETPIGWIPIVWRSDKFGDHVSVIDPNPSHRYPPQVDGGLPICSTENFHDEDGFVFKKPKLVSFETFQSQNNRCQFKYNDVIFARKGKIGLARRYGEESKVFSHTVVVMKPSSKNVDANWLLWLCRSDWLLKAIDVMMNTNSGVPTLGVEFIKGISVPLPSVGEQEKINNYLDSISRKIQSENQRREKLLKQKSGLMHDLLTGKIRVKIEQTAHV